MFKTMLVEDNSSFRQLVKNDLKSQFPAMDIIEAGEGIEAFQKIDSHHPNLIFMDIQLPGQNGLELTRKIKADHPEIIIIILTNKSWFTGISRGSNAKQSQLFPFEGFKNIRNFQIGQINFVTERF